MFVKKAIKKLMPAALLMAVYSVNVSATVVDIRLQGTIEGGMVSNGNITSFSPDQQDYLNNIDTGSNAIGDDGTPFDFTFRFDTATPYSSAIGGWAATLISGSIGSMTDFSPYTSFVSTYGDTSTNDTLRISLYRDLDEELGYRGSWGILNYFEIFDFDGNMFEAMANSDTVPFDNSIIDSSSVEFRADRNRNGLYYAYYFSTATVGISNAASNEGGSGSVTVPEPATLALFGLGLLGIEMTRRKKEC